MRSIAPLASGTEFLGRYRIVGVLGTGRNGQACAAQRVPEGSPCALKLMSAELLGDAELRAAFVREAMAMAGAASSSLARTLDAGIDEATGQPWVATELLAGKDLSARVHLWGRVPLADVERVVRGIADALAAGLERSVVHYDLTPRSVHLSPDEPPVTKLRGLGVSRFLFLARFGEHPPYGSPLWMAPEQLEGKREPTAASNVWSLGLIAFHALTGRTYWTKTEDDAVTREVLSEPIVPASERARSFGREDPLPDWFDAWFAKCVARSPKQRFIDARAAAAAWGAVGRVSFDDQQRPTLPRLDEEIHERVTRPVAPVLPVPTPPPVRAPAKPPEASPAPPAPPPAAASVEPPRRRSAAAVVAILAMAAAAVWFWTTQDASDREPTSENTPTAGSAAPPAPATPPTASSAGSAGPSEAAGAASSARTEGAVSTLEAVGYDLDAALRSLNRVYYGNCHVPTNGKLLIQFAPSGNVKDVKVEEGDYDEETTACLRARFGAATMPPFTGKPHYVTAALVAAP